MDCQFCKEPEKTNLIYSTKFWDIILTKDQRYIGRSVIVLKRHCPDLPSLKKEEWDDFINIVKKFEEALKKSFGATMFNWTCLMCDAYLEKNPNPHVHWHVRPRYANKIKVGESIFEDLEFGYHYNRADKIEIPENIRRIIISKIKGNYPE